MKYLRIPLVDSFFMDFCYIPAGGFLMGTDFDEFDTFADFDESPQHLKNLSEYLIGKYPVTNEQYLLFIQQTGHIYPSHFVNGTIPIGKKKHPIVNVNMDDSLKFCEWMTKVTDYDVFLPGEAQWEKAARGEYGRQFPWGNDNPNEKLLNYCNLNKGTTSVDMFQRGESCYGVCDLAGNVWEWTESPYGLYPVNTAKPTRREWGNYLVIRGGAWNCSLHDVRSANREKKGWREKADNLGFRCACDPTKKPKGHSNVIRFIDS